MKFFAEHIVAENCEPIDSPYWNLKCAGMPDRCKDLFIRSMNGDRGNDSDPNEAREFLQKTRTIDDYGLGLRVPLKLMPKRIKGGIVLLDTWYEMRA